MFQVFGSPGESWVSKAWEQRNSQFSTPHISRFKIQIQNSSGVESQRVIFYEYYVQAWILRAELFINLIQCFCSGHERLKVVAGYFEAGAENNKV